MLKKDLIELCLLHLLYEKDTYGYEMLDQIYHSIPNTQESAIYALLRELCRDGFTQQYIGTLSVGPARKYYHITEQGITRYRTLLKEWQSLRDALAGLGIE